MQFNKYASLLIALIAGIAVTSDHEYSFLIAVVLMAIAGMWSNFFRSKEDKQ